MKPDYLSWPEYLRRGVISMEGYYSQRMYGRAEAIFKDCIGHLEPTAADFPRPQEVEAEAHFRLAQCYYYQRKTAFAREAFITGHRWLQQATLSANHRAQCLLLYGIVDSETAGDYFEAYNLYRRLWEDAEVTDQKLRADIANRLARTASVLAQETHTESGPWERWDWQRKACFWILCAEDLLQKLSRDDPSVAHALAAVKSRAVFLFARRAQMLGSEAERVFDESGIEDANLWIALRLHRLRAALTSWQPLRALWHFGRFVCSFLWHKVL